MTDSPFEPLLKALRAFRHEPQPTARFTPGMSPQFPPVDALNYTPEGLAGIGGDLRPRTLIEAYSKGLFPWEGFAPYPWYSPDPRTILRPWEFKVSRSLRKARRNRGLTVTLDQDFPRVMAACGTTPRKGQTDTWISADFITAYHRLHQQGLAHSVEVWRGSALVGGLYGVSIGRAFFGESMFHTTADASKLALWRLCEQLQAWDFQLIDCQQDTPHLRRLGSQTLSREAYLRELSDAVQTAPHWGRTVPTLNRS